MISAKNKKGPECIGIIMDGNRRWAKEKGKTTFEGHSVGYRKLKDVVSWAKEEGVKHVVVYAFSTENWKRSKLEIEGIFLLFRRMIFEELSNLKKEKVRVRFIGQIERFPKDLQEGVRDLEKDTKNFKDITLTIAVSYGARAEILDAIERVKKANKKITEENFAQSLWTKDVPDPDLVIRTGGEMRLSNFLLWQSAYSELFFTKTFWPAFTKQEFKKILKDFSLRERRRGA